ncbi:hypothetical protein PM033_15125 [Halorubrum ezzemoulense]|uniref:hypothetical protein n=1 Tax=Halorubrum ezzemoulense TaxID=337243 RepID=UPI00232FB40C|nr:hypothetical protein [Halorubrum ezzemoulense]MDB2253077.1 hypothetical protein [Halorubrum ezzemoulense]
MTSYDTIVIKDGVIEGKLADGGVVTIPNKAWTEIDEDSLEGNWEQVTRTIVEDVIDARFLETDDPGETLSVDHDRFVDTLADSSIVEHNEPETERQRAELLLEHLTREGVYERRGRKVVVLDELDASSDQFSKLNWSVFFSSVSKKFDSVIQNTEAQKEVWMETFAELDEYEMLMERISREVETPISAGQMAKEIRRIKRVKNQFTKSEQDLREASIINISDMSFDQQIFEVALKNKIDKQEKEKTPEVSWEIAKLNTICPIINTEIAIDTETADDLFDKKENLLKQQKIIRITEEFENRILDHSASEQSVQETVESLNRLAEEHDINLAGGVETTANSETTENLTKGAETTESGSGSNPQEES